MGCERVQDNRYHVGALGELVENLPGFVVLQIEPDGFLLRLRAQCGEFAQSYCPWNCDLTRH